MSKIAWFYVDDGFSDSKPVMSLPDDLVKVPIRLAACGLWVLGGSWSAKEELDGLIPTAKLKSLHAPNSVIAALLSPGTLNAPLCDPDPAGIRVKNWPKWQPTRAELRSERVLNQVRKEADAERKRAERAAKNGGDPGRIRRRSRGRNVVTSADAETRTDSPTNMSASCPTGHSSDVHRDLAGARALGIDPTRPDPTILSTSGYLPTEVTLGSTPKPKTATNGTRLPAGWEPPSDVVAQQRADHPTLDIAAILEDFRDYWTAKTGKDATKRDWPATWRRWIRKEAEKTPRPAPTPGTGMINGRPMSTSEKRYIAAQALKNELPMSGPLKGIGR